MTTAPQVPGRLFHATRPSAVDSIREHGLQGHGVVFAAESPEHAMGFISFRLAVGMTGRTVEREVEATGEALEDYRRQAAERGTVRVDDEDRVWVQVPELEHNSHAAIFTIDTTRFDADGWMLSNDHIPFFFGDAPSWAYTAGTIPADALVDLALYPINQPREVAQ